MSYIWSDSSFRIPLTNNYDVHEDTTCINPLCVCGFPTVAAVPVIGFEEPSYSVLEGFSVSACVNITGVAVEPLALQMVTVLAGTAGGI